MLAKSKLNSIGVLISKVLIDSNISHDKFVLINNVKKYESINPKDVRFKNGRIMLLSKCAVSNSKKSKFNKEQEASGLSTSLAIRTPLSQIPLLGPLLI